MWFWIAWLVISFIPFSINDNPVPWPVRILTVPLAVGVFILIVLFFIISIPQFYLAWKSPDKTYISRSGRKYTWTIGKK